MARQVGDISQSQAASDDWLLSHVTLGHSISVSTIHGLISSVFSHVHVRYILSPVRLSVACNARAPYLGG